MARPSRGTPWKSFRATAATGGSTASFSRTLEHRPPAESHRVCSAATSTRRSKNIPNGGPARRSSRLSILQTGHPEHVKDVFRELIENKDYPIPAVTGFILAQELDHYGGLEDLRLKLLEACCGRLSDRHEQQRRIQLYPGSAARQPSTSKPIARKTPAG